MKIISLKIKHCGECPFCYYDGNYGMSYTSGYNCTNVDSEKERIVDDRGSQIAELHKLPIPKWCGLMDLEK